MTTINPDAERLIALLFDRAVATDTLGEADWQRIVELARKQGVAPALHARLKKREVALPPAIAGQLRQMYLASAVRNTRLFFELGKVLHALQAARIPVIPLKGACLAQAVYGNIALRPMRDLDLLVKFVDIAPALNVLRAAGYVPDYTCDPAAEQAEFHHMPTMSRPGGIPVELHWTIASPIYHSRLRHDDLAQMWERAVPAIIGDVAVRTLAPTDLLLHLCVHASVHHRFDGAGLRNLLDIAHVIRFYGGALDWTQFTARANQWGVANGVWLAVRLAETWTGVAIPGLVWDTLDATPLDEATTEWVRHKVLDGSTVSLRSNVVRLEGKVGLAGKWGALRDVLFPSRTVLARLYHTPAHSWRILGYYPMRFKDLWTRYRHAVWRCVRRDPAFLAEARLEKRLRDYLGWP